MRRRTPRRALAPFLATALVSLACATNAGAATITEFPLGAPPSHIPGFIEAGPDGNLWFTDRGFKGGIGRISMSGEAFASIGSRTSQNDLSFAPNGTLFWVGDEYAGRRFPSGESREAPIGANGFASIVSPNNVWYWSQMPQRNAEFCNGDPFSVRPEPLGCTYFADDYGKITGFAFDAHGDLWGAIPANDSVHKLTGSPQVLVELPPASEPRRLAAGPDGNIWATAFNADAIERITPAGLRTRFPLPAGSQPEDIVTGPDGALWFTEFGANKIGRITTAGTVTAEYAVPTPASGPKGIAVGLDGNLWFAESGAGKIARLVPDPPPAAGPPAAAADRTPPAFTRKPSFSPARFAVAGGARAAVTRRRRAPAGAKLNVALSEAARVTASFSRPAPGRRKGRRCVAPRAAPKGAAPCKRSLPVGTRSWPASAGPSQLPFNGKVKGKALEPGPYAATLTARDGAGNLSPPMRASFTIVAG